MGCNKDPFASGLPDTACRKDGVKTKSLINNRLKVVKVLQRSCLKQRWNSGKFAAQPCLYMGIHGELVEQVYQSCGNSMTTCS